MMKARRLLLMASAVLMMLILTTAAEAASATAKGKVLFVNGLGFSIMKGHTIEITLRPGGYLKIANLTTRKSAICIGSPSDGEPLTFVEDCTVISSTFSTIPVTSPPGQGIFVGDVLTVGIFFHPDIQEDGDVVGVRSFHIASGCGNFLEGCTAAARLSLDKLVVTP